MDSSSWNHSNKLKASVYGKREGFLPGLCILSNNPKNIFRQSRGYKTGVVHGVNMLARSDMVKPEAVTCSCFYHFWSIKSPKCFTSFIVFPVKILVPADSLRRWARRKQTACHTWAGQWRTSKSKNKCLDTIAVKCENQRFLFINQGCWWNWHGSEDDSGFPGPICKVYHHGGHECLGCMACFGMCGGLLIEAQKPTVLNTIAIGQGMKTKHKSIGTYYCF